MITPSHEPRLSREEWHSVAAALRDSDAAGRSANPTLEAVRQFTSLTRRYRRPADQCRPELVRAGFNDREIDALALLSI